MAWGHDARKGALASIAVFALLASLITVFSPPALGDGNPPHVECASTDPAWNGEYWKVQIDNGMLSTVETNVAGTISLDADGSWTNNNDDPVFRTVLKSGVGDGQVLSGMWETDEVGTIDFTLNGLAHVTFCFTDEVPEEPEPLPTPVSSTTTTSPSSTTTTAAGPTTTTAAGPTTTTAVGPTTTTSTDAWTPSTSGESTTTPATDETATNAAANSTEVGDSTLAGYASQANESGEELDGSKTDSSESHEPESSLPAADRDTGVTGPTIGGSGGPPAPGQPTISSDTVPDVSQGSDQFPTLEDLAILGALISAIAVVLVRRRHLG